MFYFSFNTAVVSGSMESQRPRRHGAENWHALQTLREILQQKETEVDSRELQNSSPQKNLAIVVKNLKGTTSISKYKAIDVLRLVNDVPNKPRAGTNETREVNKQMYGRKLLTTDSSASSSNDEAKTWRTGIPSRGQCCGDSCRSNLQEYLQGREIERLNERLKILEDETEAMKKELFEHFEGRNELVSEIYHKFQTILHHCLQVENQEHEEISS